MRNLTQEEHPVAQWRQIAKREEIKCDPMWISALELDGLCTVAQANGPAADDALEQHANFGYWMGNRSPETLIGMDKANAMAIGQDLKWNRLANVAVAAVNLNFHGV